jgi:hypothetical protein
MIRYRFPFFINAVRITENAEVWRADVGARIINALGAPPL